MAGSYRKCVFNYLRSCKAVFSSDFYFKFSPAVYENSSFSLSLPTLSKLIFSFLTTLISKQSYLVVVLICVSSVKIQSAFLVQLFAVYSFLVSHTHTEIYRNTIN